MSKKNKEKKKEKVVYYDDNSTISDMSEVHGAFSPIIPNKKQKAPKAPSRFFDKMGTFFSAMKMMFVPMLICLALVCAFFGILYLLAT